MICQVLKMQICFVGTVAWMIFEIISGTIFKQKLNWNLYCHNLNMCYVPIFWELQLSTYHFMYHMLHTVENTTLWTVPCPTANGEVVQDTVFVAFPVCHYSFRPKLRAFESYSFWTRLDARKTESCHDANFVLTGSTGGCLNDNFRCQWWRSWQLSVFSYIY